MKRVLFVCTGNICRSPMAEGLLRLAMGGEAEVSSAGLGAAPGYPPSAHAVAAMEEVGADIRGIRSRMVSPELVAAADAVFVMTYGHLDLMLMLYPAAADKVFLVREFEPGLRSDEREIADPIGASLEVYRRARDEIRSAIPSILGYLRGERAPAEEVMKDHHSRIEIAIGADHGGVELKKALKAQLDSGGYRVRDVGAHSADSVDYPDYAREVARAVACREADFGILVCRTGIGMSMAANRYPGVRAALVDNAATAKISREHNDANVLCLAGDRVSARDAEEIVKVWLAAAFAGGRHERRVDKMDALAAEEAGCGGPGLAGTDPRVFAAVQLEHLRQSENIELIASENFASRAVREAQGSCLTNKYAEGYPGKRYYGGCEHVDVVESVAIERALQLFGAEHANVQPHSGSQANMAVYFSVLKPGDRILTMNLAHGGHLTHGHPKNFSGQLYEVVHYGVSEGTETIDYDALEAQAREARPKMITAGASAYSRIIDFERMRRIADGAGAYLFVDMAHIAGLVAAGLHPSPVPYADFVTTTTHKTLRGPRGGLILCPSKHAREIDSLMFPGVQGGPLMHVIAAKAVCFLEALRPDFKAYQEQVLRNARALCEGMKKNGYRIVSGTTENHVMLVDVQPLGITGKDAESALDRAGITVNKNAIPFDKQSPFKAGGIRLGSPAVTTRGFKEEEMFETADLIHEALRGRNDPAKLEAVRARARALTRRFPLPA